MKCHILPQILGLAVGESEDILALTTLVKQVQMHTHTRLYPHRS